MPDKQNQLHLHYCTALIVRVMCQKQRGECISQSEGLRRRVRNNENCLLGSTKDQEIDEKGRERQWSLQLESATSEYSFRNEFQIAHSDHLLKEGCNYLSIAATQELC